MSEILRCVLFNCHWKILLLWWFFLLFLLHAWTCGSLCRSLSTLWADHTIVAVVVFLVSLRYRNRNLNYFLLICYLHACYVKSFCLLFWDETKRLWGPEGWCLSQPSWLCILNLTKLDWGRPNLPILTESNRFPASYNLETLIPRTEWIRPRY